MRKLSLALILALLAGGAWAADLTAGIHRIEAEVMNTPQGREKGLMYRQSMAENHGMVFVFPKADKVCMWMANTLIPLAVAFLDEKGAILNIEEMQPQTKDIHCSIRPATYALEMNAGWFQRHGIGPGQVLGGFEHLPAAQ
ncbi:MAG: DUF192 domain-containing protein [Rhodocyclaceae bacterium]|nr:DUF192 domain-containing protein [Rhodocyclaceae bacterium]